MLPTAPQLRLAGASQVPSGPESQVLAVPLPESRRDSDPESIKKPLVHHKAPRAEPFRGKGARSPPGGTSPQPSAQTLGRLVSRDEVCRPLDLTFLLGWGGGRRLLEVPEPILTPHPQGALGSTQRPVRPAPAQDSELGRRGRRAQARILEAAAAAHGISRRAEAGQAQAPAPAPGHRHLPSRPGRRLGERCAQQPTLRAESARRVGDAGGRGRVALVFLLFRTKFPSRRLVPGVGASHLRSFLSLLPAP